MSDVVGSFQRTAQAAWAIALRDFRRKYGARKLGLFWAIVEPLGYIAVLTVMLSALRQKTSPIGGEIAPFIAEGLFGYMLFNKVERAVASGIRSNAALLAFPRIKPMSIYAGRLLSEVSVLLIVFVCLYSGFIALGIAQMPHEPGRLFVPSLLVISIGFSIGIVNSSLETVIPSWGNIWSVFGRLNFFTSGIFFVAESMPPGIRSMLYYQPLIHVTEWVRSAVRIDYESRFYDSTYVMWFAACAVFFALLLERVFRKRMVDD